MARPKKTIFDPPKYRLHRGRGKAVVTIDGKDHYLGDYGTPDSLARYHALIAQWGGAVTPPTSPAVEVGHGPLLRPPAAPGGITVNELVDRFIIHADRYYRHRDGTPTAEIWAFGRVAKPLLALFGRTAADAFRPTMLKALRDELMKVTPTAKGHAKHPAAYRVRTAVNKDISRVRMIFAWGVENELVRSETYGALKLVKGLRAYRSEAPEAEPVAPVPISHVRAIRPYVSSHIWALVELQRLTGARPGELLALRPVDIDTTANPWTFAPSQHKTSHHGHKRMILFGPKAQAVLHPFLKGRRVDAYLFDPQEAERERHDKAPTHRRKDQRQNAKKTRRRLGDYYDRKAYTRAIARACERAGVPRWFPNQLRHLAATELRRKHGIDAAQTILGHKLGSAITEIYAEANTEKARRIMSKIG